MGPYIAFGSGVAVIAGWAIGRLWLEGGLQGWVQELQTSAAADVESEEMTFADRHRAGNCAGIEAVRDIFAKVWIWIFIGIAIGA